MANTYQEFLEERHRKFTTPDGVVAEIVKSAVNSPILEKEKLVKGENSEVYSVKTQKGEIVLRISRQNDPTFDTEEWAIRQCAVIGLPVPKVLYLEEKDVEGQHLSFCVESKLPGVPLNELSIDGDDLQNVLKQAGEFLKEIHTIKIDGFGGIDKEGKGEFSTFSDYINDKVESWKRLLDISDKIDIDQEDIKRAIDIVQSFRDFYDSIDKSVLLHNDYSPKHLLILDNKVVGIIDFETVIGGTPLQELARWDYYFGEEYPLKYLLEGYGNKDIIRDDFEEKIHLFRLVFGLSIIDWYEMDGNHHGMNHAKRELKRDLEYFRR